MHLILKLLKGKCNLLLQQLQLSNKQLSWLIPCPINYNNNNNSHKLQSQAIKPLPNLLHNLLLFVFQQILILKEQS